MHTDSQNVENAKRYLRGENFPFDEINEIWKGLKIELEFGYAHQVLQLLRDGVQVSDNKKISGREKEKLCQQHALCLSKDSNLSAAIRHDDAMEILSDLLPGYNEGELTNNPETLGIAGGICKRKYDAFGQIEDLIESLKYYRQGAAQPGYTDFGYTAINQAYVLDLLASLGDDPAKNTEEARRIREDIILNLPKKLELEENNWLKSEYWFYITLAEACLGLEKYDEAIQWIEKAVSIENTPYWEFETSARQFVSLVRIQQKGKLDYDGTTASNARTETTRVLNALLKDSDADVDSLLVGKIGLGLSGGGFRASLFHLGMFARLAELDVLRHVDVVSCVSGGSIIGAHYYLAVRQLLQTKAQDEISKSDYVELVQTLISNFKKGMSGGLRESSPSKFRAIQRLLTKQGALDSEKIAEALEQEFYSPYMERSGEIWMDEIKVNPKDHDPNWKDQGPFNPKRHNWQRKHKVPSLVLNSTTMNTGHCWQFTVSSMGETPFAMHKEVSGVPRLRRSWYSSDRRMRLGKAVAASAAVPAVIEPLVISNLYAENGKGYDVRLVDGGVYDNQGSHGLLAQDCNVLIISDAAGQLTAENHPSASILTGTASFAGRAMSVLMERIRQSGFADLKARHQSKLLRGLMYVHMKAGLYAEPINWVGSQESFTPPRRTILTVSGVRRDFQKALAEIRTDLDDFNVEADYIIACGYQMAKKSYNDSIGGILGVPSQSDRTAWSFEEALRLITSTSEETAEERKKALEMLVKGSKLNLG